MYLYLRTEDGLGKEKEVWIAPQALNRVVVEPVPIDYFGNRNEGLGKPPKQICYTVDNFKPNSWVLTKDIQLHLDKIATAIVHTIKRKLRQLRLKRKQKASVNLYIEFRGHIDKNTDIHPKGLDDRRLKAVHEDLDWRIPSKSKAQGLKDRFNFSYFMNSTYLPEGSARPIRSTISGKNRRVEICILGLRVTNV
jgi:hypothetical protein